MRGAPLTASHIMTHGRIIPADAGSTITVCHVCYRERDHPRGCGEHMKSSRESLLQMGSSPRMRGARVHADDVTDENRIIPADAGSTLPFFLAASEMPDHPRGCGEHVSMRSCRSFR